jgi:hypothetical protein
VRGNECPPGLKREGQRSLIGRRLRNLMVSLSLRSFLKPGGPIRYGFTSLPSVTHFWEILFMEEKEDLEQSVTLF